MSKGVKKSDGGKAWNRRKANARPYARSTIPVAKTFLIVCEGVNTEPEYFKAFPVVSAEVKVHGAGRVRTSLVTEAIRLKKLEENKGREVWCVFDFDNKPDDETIAADFNEAIALVARNGIQVAWSNDSIELWFLLHYQYLDNALTRHQYYPRLEQIWELKESYETMGKRQEFCLSLYQSLLPYQSAAIVNAEKLYALQDDGRPPALKHPCTSVFRLVRELNKYLKK